MGAERDTPSDHQTLKYSKVHKTFQHSAEMHPGQHSTFCQHDEVKALVDTALHSGHADDLTQKSAKWMRWSPGGFSGVDLSEPLTSAVQMCKVQLYGQIGGLVGDPV